MMNGMADLTLTRGNHGMWDRSPESASRDAEAARLRSQGLSYRAIGTKLGISGAGAHLAVQRCLRDTMEQPGKELREMESTRLNDLIAHTYAILNTHYPLVIDKEDTGLRDPVPALAAIRTLQGLVEARCKLFGLNAPTMNVEYQVDVNSEAAGRVITEALDAAMTVVLANVDPANREAVRTAAVQAARDKLGSGSHDALGA